MTSSDDTNLSPSTANYIASHANTRADAVAIIDGERRCTYAQFDDGLRRMTRALQGFGLKPGSFVAVEWTTLYSHWLILLAFENLGIATITYLQGDGGKQPYFDRMDFVLTTQDWSPDSEIPNCRLTNDWFVAALQQEPVDKADGLIIGPEMAHQIVHTSGTTGASKLMIRTRANHEFLTAGFAADSGLTQQSRYLVTMGMNIASVYRYATNCIRLGGTCIWDSRRDIADAVAWHGATEVTLLPVALTNLLKNLPEDYEKRCDLTVTMIGAPVPKQIRTQALEQFAGRLIEGYSTNETGRVCTMNDEGVGVIWPGVSVEVVDEDDRPVEGAEGNVRIKSAGCASGYLHDPVATREKFRDGWFYPGDLGVMLGPKTLKILGRTDDILNVRGIKFLPYDAEKRMIAALGMKDICISTVADAEGNTHICIALVTEEGQDTAQLAQQLSKYISPKFGQFQVVPMGSLPRTATGKIRRKALSGGLADYLRRKGVVGF